MRSLGQRRRCVERPSAAEDHRYYEPQARAHAPRCDILVDRRMRARIYVWKRRHLQTFRIRGHDSPTRALVCSRGRFVPSAVVTCPPWRS